MERLLNIKEAAKILNVSQMTIRRWTNAKALRCYRVGGKQERRFRIRDLQDYLDKEHLRINTPEAPLGFGNFTAPDGSHMTHLSLNTQEALEIGAAYMQEGINNNETVLLAAPEDGKKRFINILKKQNADVDGLIQKGKFHITDGTDNPADMAAYISQMSADTRGRFRAFGDMTWTKNKGWPLAALRDFEESANAMPTSADKLFLCQYCLENFSGMAAMMALETHEYTIYQGKLAKSPYFKKSMSTA